MIDAIAARLLGRHVGGRADDEARRRVRTGRSDRRCVGRDHFDELRQAEVDDLRVAVLGDHHVGRLEIAVDQPLFVRTGKPFSDLDRDIERALGLQGPTDQDLAELVTADQLHRDERHTLGLADFVDHRDVRVLDQRRGPRFLEHPLAADTIVHEILGQDLERHLAPQVQVARAIHHAHAAAADLLDDFVVRERWADHFGVVVIANK